MVTQTSPITDEKEEWQKPELKELDISETKTGFLGPFTDGTNTSATIAS